MSGLISHARALFAVAALFLAPCAFADGPGTIGPNVAQPPLRAAPAPATPAPQGRSGAIPLLDGAFNLNLPAAYRFYSAEEAYAFLQRNGATPPSGAVLGMVAPADERIDQPGAWATIVSYQDIGYVAPTSSAGLQAPNFEADVRAARVTQNRPFEGFAAQPAFDGAAADLTWAERTAAPGSGGRDLRHELKMLGRKGVVTLTSIGNADQMTAITAAAPDLISMFSFAEGNRYADFQLATDAVSAFTVPALVTGIAPAAAQAIAQTPTSSGDSQTSFGGLAGLFPWIAVGLIVLAGAGYMFMRRRRDPNLAPEGE